jgi:heat shock protein HslJ
MTKPRRRLGAWLTSVLAVSALGCVAIPPSETPLQAAASARAAPSARVTSSDPIIGASASSDPVPSTAAVTPPPAGPTPMPLDSFAGTAWRAVALDGSPVVADPPPSIVFDMLGRPSGVGFSGCDEFGFGATFQGPSVAIRDLLATECRAATAELDAAFLSRFTNADAWALAGDQLTFSGPAGEVAFSRDLPPPGDPARVLADRLRQGEWRMLRAPGVERDRLPPPLEFGDAEVVAAGSCGFSSGLRYGAGGLMTFLEVGWDTAGCDPGDARPIVKRVLEAVRTGRVRSDGRVVLNGPLGDVVLGQ